MFSGNCLSKRQTRRVLHSGQLSLQLPQLWNRGFSLSICQTSRDKRIRWWHLSTIPGSTPHCLVNTEGNVTFLGTRKLVDTSSVMAPFVVVKIIKFSPKTRLWQSINIPAVRCHQINHLVLFSLPGKTGS